MSEESAKTSPPPTTQPRKRWGIVTRTVLLITSIATVAVVVAGIAVAPFVRSAAVAEASGALERLADLTAAYVERSDGRRPPDRLIARPLERILRREGVTGYLVSREGGLPPALQGSGISDDQFNALLAGEPISSPGRDGLGGRILIEGRPVTGGAVILTQSVDVAGELGTKFLARIAAALALGLVISVGIAYVVARRLSRPLRDAQGVAHRMAGGERDERLTPRGPAEVADIAEALNALNAALATSEGRQREFLLSVSHELRTPLTAIRGYAEALNDDILDPEELTNVGATIGHEASRLDRLVHDLLDLARLGAADFHVNAADVDVREILTEAAEVWRTRCDRDGVTLTLAEAARPVHVHVDAMRLRQIIDNLMENALRVSPQGSQIHLAIHTDSAIADGSYAVIEVRDSGPGLSEDDLAVAFEPGALHERYRGVRPVGTGLGLALVDRLASRMGGAAAVTSSPGVGSSFWIRIPLA
ncbi:MAG: HAMP domain-containing histidine kinase [Acidimicrobiales bacterium]|nr:MAG: hypothetical protein CBC75_05555 [Actinomycetales bacterium TMED115]RZP28568.1 MAG: HAMP domain-containing histidine kinase [Acidimicrobiales bacterium]